MDRQPAGPASDEASLVLAIAAAAPAVDGAAEAELYRRLAPRVRLYGLRHLRDAQMAADLVQQVMLILIEKLRAAELRDPAKLVSFVLGTCRMTILDLRRNAARRESLLRQYGNVADRADAPESLSLDQDKLARCMERLSERARAVLVQSFFEEKSAGEIGQEFGISAENTRVIRHRAVAQLRECMGGAAAGGR
jgi:RNA polymerase sigma-70 factor, ECF subfamily